MKRITVKLPLILIAAAGLTSCLSTGSSGQNEMQKWIFGPESLNNIEIPAREIQVSDRIENSEENLSLNNFGKITWLYSILGRFDLHESLSLQGKKDLMDGLFGDIPATDDSEIYRMTALGEYFESGDNLVFYSTLYHPSDKAPEGSRYILEIVANCLVTTDKATEETKITVFKDAVMSGFNWHTNGVIFENEMIVKASNLASPDEYEAQLLKGDALSMINLADSYTKDEILENDEEIPALLTNNMTAETNKEIEKVTASLNLFQYYVYQEDLVRAEEQLAQAKSMGESLTQEDFRQVLDIEAPHMLELMKYLISI